MCVMSCIGLRGDSTFWSQNTQIGHKEKSLGREAVGWVSGKCHRGLDRLWHLSVNQSTYQNTTELLFSKALLLNHTMATMHLATEILCFCKKVWTDFSSATKAATRMFNLSGRTERGVIAKKTFTALVGVYLFIYLAWGWHKRFIRH